MPEEELQIVLQILNVQYLFGKNEKTTMTAYAPEQC